MSEKFIARSTQIAARPLGGEMMIMSAVDSTLFNLNETATVIWQAANGQTSLLEIVRQNVCAEFDVDPAEAYRDAEAFVEELAQHGILLVSDQPFSSAPARPAEMS